MPKLLQTHVLLPTDIMDPADISLLKEKINISRSFLPLKNYILTIIIRGTAPALNLSKTRRCHGNNAAYV